MMMMMIRRVLVVAALVALTTAHMTPPKAPPPPPQKQEQVQATSTTAATTALLKTNKDPSSTTPTHVASTAIDEAGRVQKLRALQRALTGTLHVVTSWVPFGSKLEKAVGGINYNLNDLTLQQVSPGIELEDVPYVHSDSFFRFKWVTPLTSHHKVYLQQIRAEKGHRRVERCWKIELIRDSVVSNNDELREFMRASMESVLCQAMRGSFERQPAPYAYARSTLQKFYEAFERSTTQWSKNGAYKCLANNCQTFLDMVFDNWANGGGYSRQSEASFEKWVKERQFRVRGGAAKSKRTDRKGGGGRGGGGF